MKRIGKYEVIRVLGRGATSSVYLAHDPFADRQVAIKLFNPDIFADSEQGRRFKKLFLTEASLAGKLAHPHIAAIYDAVAGDDQGGLNYLVMEYVDGGTLEPYCKVDNLLDIDKVIEIIFKCCRALDYAWHHGVIHRDIKPANILLTGGTEIKISDFGAALTATTETTQVSGIGSPAYMSPQQIKEQPLTHQTDIYSLGVVFYQLLAGSLPFKATNNYSMIYQILNVDPPPPSVHRHEVPPVLDIIVKRALEKDAANRYQSWDEFGHALITAFNNLRKPEENVPDTEKFNTLRKLAFFDNFSEVELWEVLRITGWNRYPAGTTLIREGDVGTSFFILVGGEVEVSKNGKSLNVLHAGECFGEMAYLSKKHLQRTASITALDDIKVIEVNARALERASETCRNQFNAAFLEILVDRLAAANIRLSQLLAKRNLNI
ncbi:MAG: serine/threonine-protein kinase [Pseudomonadota bacterium]